MSGTSNEILPVNGTGIVSPSTLVSYVGIITSFANILIVIIVNTINIILFSFYYLFSLL